jgi:hypothetical protein
MISTTLFAMLYVLEGENVLHPRWIPPSRMTRTSSALRFFAVRFGFRSNITLLGCSKVLSSALLRLRRFGSIILPRQSPLSRVSSRNPKSSSVPCMSVSLRILLLLCVLCIYPRLYADLARLMPSVLLKMTCLSKSLVIYLTPRF